MSRHLRQLDGEAAFVIDHVLAEDECWELIELAEDEGFDMAPVRIGLVQETVSHHARSCMRVIFESDELAHRLWERIGDHLPDAHGINAYFRVFRYDVDQRFLTHRDGVVHLQGGLSSEYTLLLYLNSDCDGGQTRLFLDTGDEVDVEPLAGRVLLFEHDIAHEGRAVDGGVKYVIRSEILYAR